jgi:hypothetical protein
MNEFSATEGPTVFLVTTELQDDFVKKALM